MIEYVAAHEVGHTLGFQHNMKASSMYPAAKIRDREWVKKMGHTPTLMDYSRFNYVNASAFQVPSWLINAEILRRIEPIGVLDRVKNSQQRVLGSLLSSARITRLVEQEALDGDMAYRPVEFLGDVRRGIWSEFYGEGPIHVDAYRRNLQRGYVETLADRINGPQASADEARALFRGELKTLDADLRKVEQKTTDRATRVHIDDIRMQIARALDPSVRTPATPPGRSTTDVDFDVTVEPESCWVDFSIRGN